VVSANVSSECCVVTVPDIHGGEAAEGFVIEEPDDERTFTMVDQGKRGGKAALYPVHAYSVLSSP
jgi:hypothetical protein